MPYGEAEKAAIESQALRAIVSGGLPLGAFEDHEMRLLIGMFRTTAPAILPAGKVAGRRLLMAATADVEAITIKALKGTTAGLSYVVAVTSSRLKVDGEVPGKSSKRGMEKGSVEERI
ncbi:hypothetical protein B0H10DRAFT_2232681 [Mycena sp. CBHHK59/15]|nr:hypothetical protein B0H10DRAFT_2232681 [Mycena sp. CBHHK59/15]